MSTNHNYNMLNTGHPLRNSSSYPKSPNPPPTSSPPHSTPPVPPNPEKDALLTALSTSLVSQIRKTVADNNAAVAPLQAQQSALRTATSRLESELSQLQQLDAALASNEQILRNAMREADRVMEDAGRRTVPDVDDVLVAPHAVGNQLYALVAEEKACADAVNILGRALDRGRLGLMFSLRAVAREQFLKKMLIKKIERGMGLDGVQ
ncbi:Suppressor protein stp22 of temperature-sensitive alpha-factor receptor and arginine permease [Coniosporium tulheliwenetii]|uniref:Suppressor protein stp22 of temperature-sensitive alpha-factor receptor and arginine permease n=1 Tax=Coniosporium tulheliwenetii TaxID=3383036 RepID=A0ACC2YUK1_9PEZI|nr:Suppressor protein stp22 of temperature-sensitive alpha-factor receptor and arginine permease [Cladosporium sp. JES 115]